MEKLKNQTSPEKMEKPPFLYHGSRHKGLEEIEPRRNSMRDSEEGELIFATQDMGLASVFMSDSHNYGSGKFDGITYSCIVGSREEFIENDKGGHIYVLPSNSFETDLTKGLGEYEWTSKEKVKPIKTVEYQSALDAMLEQGVQVYFVDEETHRRIKESGDHGYSLLKNMQSENQRRGINIKELK